MTRDNESRDIIHMSKETYLRVKWDLQVKRDICTWSCWLARSMTRDNESIDIMHMSEETYLRVKRDRWTSQKRPMCMILLASTVHDSRQRVNRHHAHVKQTRQMYISKETNTYVKRDLYACQKRHVHMWNKTYIQEIPWSAVYDSERHVSRDYMHVKRDLPTCQKRLTNMSKETNKRGLRLRTTSQQRLYVCQKRPTSMSKYVKRDQQTCQKRTKYRKLHRMPPWVPTTSSQRPTNLQKKPISLWKETYTHVIKDLHADNYKLAKSTTQHDESIESVYMSKEIYFHTKRDIFSNKTNILVKRDIYTRYKRSICSKLAGSNAHDWTCTWALTCTSWTCHRSCTCPVTGQVHELWHVKDSDHDWTCIWTLWHVTLNMKLM